MKVKILSGVLVPVFVWFVATAVAQCPGHAKPPCDKPCGSAECERTECGKSACGTCPQKSKIVAEGEGVCPITKKAEAILASMPSVRYQVDGNMICCRKMAEARAEKTSRPVRYVVGEATFDRESEAKATLASQLEQKLESLRTIQYSVDGQHMSCPITAGEVARETHTEVAYCVGGFDFTDEEKAEKAVRLVEDACSAVRMTYKIGDETFCCAKEAEAACHATGNVMTYVVGEEGTSCEATANLMLQQAKIRAAVEAAGSVFAN